MSAWEAQVSDPSWRLITATTLCPQLLALLLRLCGQPLHLHSVHKVECEGEGTAGGHWDLTNLSPGSNSGPEAQSIFAECQKGSGGVWGRHWASLHSGRG